MKERTSRIPAASAVGKAKSRREKLGTELVSALNDGFSAIGIPFSASLAKFPYSEIVGVKITENVSRSSFIVAYSCGRSVSGNLDFLAQETRHAGRGSGFPKDIRHPEIIALVMEACSEYADGDPNAFEKCISRIKEYFDASLGKQMHDLYDIASSVGICTDDFVEIVRDVEAGFEQSAAYCKKCGEVGYARACKGVF